MIDQSIMDRCPKQIKSEDDVRIFFRWILQDCRISFHPDDRFAQYVEFKTGGKRFTNDQARCLDDLMDQAFNVADPYEVAMEVWKEFDAMGE